MNRKAVFARVLWVFLIVVFAGCASPPSPKSNDSSGKKAINGVAVNSGAKVPERSPEPLIPTTDEQIRARYDQMIRQDSGQLEYRVSHILVATEPEAKAVLVELGNGKKFNELAHLRSTDRGSAEIGGSLGWSVARIFPSGFAQAVRLMTAPGLYPVPVQTSYGWHVISIEEIRTYQPPSYESFRQGIEALKSEGM